MVAYLRICLRTLKRKNQIIEKSTCKYKTSTARDHRHQRRKIKNTTDNDDDATSAIQLGQSSPAPADAPNTTEIHKSLRPRRPLLPEPAAIFHVWLAISFPVAQPPALKLSACHFSNISPGTFSVSHYRARYPAFPPPVVHLNLFLPRVSNHP